MTDRRRPVHLAVLVGLATGTYATALAGVTTLQSRTDLAMIADRAPVVRIADAAAFRHDQLEAAVEEASRRYSVLAARYDGFGRGFGDLEAAIDGLAARVEIIAESARSLPTRIALPTVRALPATRPAARPKTHGTTGASG